MDTHDTTAADAKVSAHGEQSPKMQTQSAATSESQPVAPNGENVAAYDQNMRLAAIDASSTAPLPGNPFLPGLQDSTFTAIDGAIPSDGTLPLGVTIPFNPILPGLDVLHSLQPTNDHAMSAGTATYRSTRNSPPL